MSNQLTVVESFQKELASPSQTKALQAVLPDHIDLNAFRRISIMAVNKTPSLLNADRQSLLTSLQTCASDGLVPDGKDAALVEFKKKVKKKDEKTGRFVTEFVTMVRYMPMVSGILKRARQSGQLSTITARCVYENDEFDYWIDEDGEHLKHKPKFGGSRGKFVLVYAMAKMKTGDVIIEPIEMSEVEKIKRASRTSTYGPWVDWYERMAEKSALHRIARRLPNSSELSEMMSRDEWMYGFKNRNEKDVTDLNHGGFNPFDKPEVIEHEVKDVEHEVKDVEINKEPEQKPANEEFDPFG